MKKIAAAALAVALAAASFTGCVQKEGSGKSSSAEGADENVLNVYTCLLYTSRCV